MDAKELICRLEFLKKNAFECFETSESSDCAMFYNGEEVAYSVAIRLLNDFLRSNDSR